MYSKAFFLETLLCACFGKYNYYRHAISLTKRIFYSRQEVAYCASDNHFTTFYCFCIYCSVDLMADMQRNRLICLRGTLNFMFVPRFKFWFKVFIVTDLSCIWNSNKQTIYVLNPWKYGLLDTSTQRRLQSGCASAQSKRRLLRKLFKFHIDVEEP